MRLIDADALLDVIPKTTELLRCEVVRPICDAPTIKVVPLDRLGEFGKLFMDYKGCPRGPIGRACMPLEEEVLQMKPITDVDGGKWIPVNAYALRDLVNRYTMLRGSGTSIIDAVPVVRCKDCTRRSPTGFCPKHGHAVTNDFFCAYGTTEAVKKKIVEKKAADLCGITGHPCSRCMPGPCDHRRTVIADDSGQ